MIISSIRVVVIHDAIAVYKFIVVFAPFFLLSSSYDVLFRAFIRSFVVRLKYLSLGNI